MTPPPHPPLKDREYNNVLRDQGCRMFQREVINEYAAMTKWRSVGEVEESTARNTCSTAHFSCIQLELNPSLRSENSASNHLTHGATHSRLVFGRFGVSVSAQGLSNMIKVKSKAIPVTGPGGL
jgi:hypothetical protein